LLAVLFPAHESNSIAFYYHHLSFTMRRPEHPRIPAYSHSNSLRVSALLIFSAIAMFERIVEFHIFQCAALSLISMWVQWVYGISLFHRISLLDLHRWLVQNGTQCADTLIYFLNAKLCSLERMRLLRQCSCSPCRRASMLQSIRNTLSHRQSMKRNLMIIYNATIFPTKTFKACWVYSARILKLHSLFSLSCSHSRWLAQDVRGYWEILFLLKALQQFCHSAQYHGTQVIIQKVIWVSWD